MTGAVRRAANATAAAVIAYAGLWILTTQVEAIRERSPFAVDPWDAVASYAAIFLPIVVAATAIRSLRHRGPMLPPATARRIAWGCGLALGIVAAADLADLDAIVSQSPTTPFITELVLASTVATVLAIVVLVPAARRLRAFPRSRPDPAEPDVVDDVLGLAVEIAERIGLGRPIGRAVERLQRFLERSAISPRRHRLLFGVFAAIVSAACFAAWVGVREGGWAQPAVPLALGTLWAAGALAIYVGTLESLRLLRPPLEGGSAAAWSG